MKEIINTILAVIGIMFLLLTVYAWIWGTGFEQCEKKYGIPQISTKLEAKDGMWVLTATPSSDQTNY